jgi:NAD(P)-dependent dehydrogenase (short-subunit alcohol dehydrogenase family)
VELSGRTAIVTGGASGIGAACARRLQTEGARVVSWDLSPNASVFCDVREASSVSDALAWTLANAGVPTVVVAAAGISGPHAPLTDISERDWDQVFAVNVRGIFLTMRDVAAAMISAGLDGTMVAISSVQGVLADPTLAPYSAAKAAVFHLIRVAALDLGPHRIRVNAIGPGPTATPMLARSMATPGYIEQIENATPLGRLGDPKLIADAVVSIMKADWITGQAIMADGGSSLMTARGSWRVRHADEGR